MLMCYVKSGKYKGTTGYLVSVSGRTADIVTQDKGIIAVERDAIYPIGINLTWKDVCDFNLD